MAKKKQTTEKTKPPISDDEQIVVQLEQELQSTREDLHGARRELESSKTEMVASKEAVLASNQELQSKMVDFGKSHQVLRQRAENLRHMADSLPVLIAYVDSGLRFQFTNQRYEEWFQRAVGDIKGEPVQAVLGKDITEKAIQYMNAALAGKPQSFELELDLPDGSERRVQMEYVPQHNEAGQVVGFFSVGHDVTRLLQAETEAAMLEASTTEKRRIGQDLHDTAGQVLTGLSYMTQSLIETLEESSPAVEIAEKIRAGIDKAAQDIRRLIRGLVPVALVEEGLMEALREMTETIEQQYDLRCEFHCAESVFVEDTETATQLYRIAQEAAANAARHADAGRIDIRLTKNASQICLEISDDGQGFAGLHTAQEGMGLKIMRHRAKAIGARFDIQPAQGKGTQVTCTLTRPN